MGLGGSGGAAAAEGEFLTRVDRRILRYIDYCIMYRNIISQRKSQSIHPESAGDIN